MAYYILHKDKNMPELGNYDCELRSWIKYPKNQYSEDKFYQHTHFNRKLIAE